MHEQWHQGRYMAMHLQWLVHNCCPPASMKGSFLKLHESVIELRDRQIEQHN